MSVPYVAHVDERGNEYTEYTRLDLDEQDYEFDPVATRDLAERPGYGAHVKKGDRFAHRIEHVVNDEDGSSTFRHYKWNYGKAGGAK